jgi:flagellar basal-body rod modification protein FlgD
MAVTTELLSSMNGTTQTTTTSSTNDNSADAIQKRFLTILLAQLNNQDPTSPLENAELTSQLAQLSTVSGIEQLNSSLGSLMTEMQTAQSLQSANMIGHSVLVSGNSVVLGSTTTTEKTTDEDGNTVEKDVTTRQGVLGIQLDSKVDKLTVSIRDASGKEVQQVDLGKQDAGVLPVIWDGSTKDGGWAKDGDYTFTVTGSYDGTSVTAKTLSFGIVGSVTTATTGVKLNVSGLGPIDVKDVVQII